MTFHPSALYSPGGQMFVCVDALQYEQLSACGWKGCPLEHAKPYPPDQAKWVREWTKIDTERKKPGPKPKD